MEAELLTSREEFNRLTALKRDELQRLISDEDRKRTLDEKRSERNELDLSTLVAAIEAVTVSEQRREAFARKLDVLDTATVQALMLNEAALRQAKEQLDAMLSNAHVLADGRRVFKTLDGSKVYDEYGHQLSEDVISPGAIDDAFTRWEALQEQQVLKTQLDAERTDLISYQEKLDVARERASDPQLTEDELAVLEAELGSAMPDAVAQAVNGKDPLRDQHRETASPAIPQDEFRLSGQANALSMNL